MLYPSVVLDMTSSHCNIYFISVRVVLLAYLSDGKEYSKMYLSLSLGRHEFFVKRTQSRKLLIFYSSILLILMRERTGRSKYLTKS